MGVDRLSVLSNSLILKIRKQDYIGINIAKRVDHLVRVKYVMITVQWNKLEKIYISVETEHKTIFQIDELIC